MSEETVLGFEAVYTTTDCLSHFITSNMPPVSDLHPMKRLGFMSKCADAVYRDGLVLASSLTRTTRTALQRV